jgi:3-carboxy-cis,cis-muconate cycloisomerase
VVGYPILPLVRQLVDSTPEDMAKYIHWGATTQDIMDTASVLQIRSGLALIRRDLETLVNILAELAERYRDT